MDDPNMYRIRRDKPTPESHTSHDVLLSFDTTASMAPFIEELRRDLQQFISEIFRKHADTKIAIIAHGDYCSTYTIERQDFTRNVAKLQEFVRSVGDTNGGDYPECYELVLHEARFMDWRKGSKRQLIMFGDAYPHEYEDFTDIMRDPACITAKKQLDWRDEADELLQMGVEICPVQFGKRERSDRFWSELAYKTYSWKPELQNADDLRVVITVAIYRGKGKECLQKYVKELNMENKKIPDSVNVNLNRLNEVPGSLFAIQLENSSVKPIEESLAVSQTRKAELAADRIRRNLCVTEEAKKQATKRVEANQIMMKELENENKVLEAKLLNRKSELEASLEDKRKIQSDLDSAMVKLTEEKTKLVQLEKKIVNNDADIAGLRAEKTDLSNQFQQSENKKKELEDQLTAKQKEIQDLEDKTRLLQTKLDDQSKELAVTKKTLTDANSKISDLETEKDELDKTLTDTKDMLSKEQGEVVENKKKIKELEDDLAAREEAEVRAAIIDGDVKLHNESNPLNKNKGTHAEVYEGRFKEFMKVAVKKIKVTNPLELEELRALMKQMLKLRHPNLIVIYGIEDPFLNRKNITVVMELAKYCLQKTALSKSRTKQIDLKLVTGYLRDAATGLAYLHSFDIPHKAVRPSNILAVGDVGKLADYSIACVSHNTHSQYTAPELREDSEPTCASDIYAMGVTILEALTGHAQKANQLDLQSVHGQKQEMIASCISADPQGRMNAIKIVKTLNNML